MRSISAVPSAGLLRAPVRATLERPGANALVLLLLLGTLWGSSYSLIMYVMQTVPAITLNAVRVSLAALVLGAYAYAQGHRFPTDSATWRWFVVQGTINPGIAWVLLTWASSTSVAA